MSSSRQFGFALVTGLFVYLCIEGAAFVADRFVVAEAPDVAIAETDSLNVRTGREQAGLGFRDPALSLHPFLGYVYTPRDPDAEPGRVPISKDGFLDDKPAVRTRTESTLLVGILGGSVAGQLGTWHVERLRTEIEKTSIAQGKDVEFIRLGLPGYHQPQQVIQLAYLLAQGGEFDIVINVDGFNEIAVSGALNVPYGVHPLYPMNWSMVSLDTPEPALRRHIGAVDVLQHNRERWSARLHNSPMSWSPLRKLAWKLYDKHMHGDLAAHAWAIQEYPADELPYFIHGPEGALEPPQGLMPMCVGVWKRCSLQMKALCDAENIRYMHVLQPNQYVPGSKTFTSKEEDEAIDSEGPYAPVVAEGYPLLRAAGRELVDAGVDFHDLTDLFTDVGETVYADACCHYNGDGNQYLSEAIARALAN